MQNINDSLIKEKKIIEKSSNINSNTNLSELNPNSANLNNEESNVENLLKLIKDQTSELKKNKKRLEKLEEKFIKTSADLKSVLSDKLNIENFLKIIFPKEMHENILKNDYGYYDTSELSKLWLVCESKNQNVFQKILNQYKNENTDLSDKNKAFLIELDNKTKDMKKLRTSYENLTNDYNESFSKFNETFSKYDLVESEKNYLLSLVDEKNKEIEELRALEIENAELKAKRLLDNIDYNNIEMLNKNSCKKENKKYEENNILNKKKEFVHFNITLNAGTQSTEEVFSLDYVENLQNIITDFKHKYEKLKKDFSEHKERSHKILLTNEENSHKLSKENEELKIKVNDINQELLKIHTHSNYKTSPLKTQSITPHKSSIDNNHTEKANKINDHYDDLNPDFKISEINSNRISVEYLKNILLKYLEAIAIGNEFQTKILENVIFSILKIPNIERMKLEEKRNRSSFYLNLWYNAKAFLSARIYGNNSDTNDLAEENVYNNSVNFEVNKDFVNLLGQKNESDVKENIINHSNN